MIKLHEQQCEGNAIPLGIDEATQYIKQIHPDWTLANDANAISRTFKFSNYYETIAFTNVVAMIAHQQDHHPSMTTGYNTCQVEFSTHSVGGLSNYDFISAAKVDCIETL